MTELFDPALWSDSYEGEPPPQQWDGQALVFVPAPDVVLWLADGGQAGDTITFDAGATDDGIGTWSIAVSGAETLASGDAGTTPTHVAYVLDRDYAPYELLMIVHSGNPGCEPTTTVTLSPASNAPPCDGPLLEVWPPPDQAYPLRIRAYAVQKPFGYAVDGASEPDDDALTTCDSRLVFLMALASAKAHSGHADANVYAQKASAMLARLRSGAHGTRRYIPDGDDRDRRIDPDPSKRWIKS